MIFVRHASLIFVHTCAQTEELQFGRAHERQPAAGAGRDAHWPAVHHALQHCVGEGVPDAGRYRAPLLLTGTARSYLAGFGVGHLGFGAGPIVATILNGMQLFRSRPDLRPVWNEFRWVVLRQLLSVGLGFLIVQAALAMAIGSDNFVIAHLLGADSVSQYAIAMRIFTLVPALLQMILMPLWPAYGESLARGDAEWAIRALKRSVVVVAGATVAAAVVLTLSGRWIIALWVGDRFHQGLWLLSGMGVWMVVTTLANVISIFLNGMNRIQVQVASAIAVAISTLAIEILATPKFGLPAMIWSTNISYLCFVWIPIALFFPRLLRNLKSKAQSPRDAAPVEPALAS